MLTPYKSEHFLLFMCLCSYMRRDVLVWHVKARVGVWSLLQSLLYFETGSPNQAQSSQPPQIWLSSQLPLGTPQF